MIARFGDVDDPDLARLEDLLVEHALEHDSPLALLRAAARELLERQLLRPGVSTLERLVASARALAERETHERLSPLLDDAARRALDALCATDIALGVSRLVWLGREATSASPAQIVAQLEKLAFLRELGATSWDLDVVAANRRRQLAALARRSTTAALAGRPDRLRYPALLCFCGEQAVRLVDEVLDRADQAVGEAHGQALRELKELKTSTAGRTPVTRSGRQRRESLPPSAASSGGSWPPGAYPRTAAAGSCFTAASSTGRSDAAL